MGLNINGLLFAGHAYQRGASFKKTATIGRLQRNFYTSDLDALAKRLKLSGSAVQAAIDHCDSSRFCEPAFKMLGAETVDSLDRSDYEQASIQHNLNDPIPTSLQQQYTAVVDGGTLEHIINFPLALKNCMDMLSIGGTLLLHLPANNCCGHGFYQFSPDLFFRLLSEENGFEMDRVIAHRIGPYGKWYQSADPKQASQRVELISFTPVHLLIAARKKEHVPGLLRMPQQQSYEVADYEHIQKQESKITRQYESRWSIAHRILAPVARPLRVLSTALDFYTRQSLFNRNIYLPVAKWPAAQ